MFGEVVAAHEPPVAHGAHKFLLAGVRPPVTRQLIGASEPLVTAVPAAAEWLLAWRRERRKSQSASESHWSHKSSLPHRAALQRPSTETQRRAK